MIKFVEGDFFDYDADIRINTVNCVGVMGAGVALAFKNKFPNMFKDYVKKCKKGEIKPGNPVIWKESDIFSKTLEIVNFPTKDHWRNPSEYKYIEDGLVWLRNYLGDKKDITLTVPALGCGHGGLDWNIVRAMITNHLSCLPINILVFNPISSKNIKKSDKKTGGLKGTNTAHFKSIKSTEDQYPSKMLNYTSSELFYYGENELSYDLSLISSTQPSDTEKTFINHLIAFCKNNNKSILFGSTVFDKKNAIYASSLGIKSGVFLPSGIAISAEKMSRAKKIDNLALYSLGNPFVSFDKKEYMKSVIARILFCEKIVFTTHRLDWIEKYHSLLISSNVESVYIKSSSLSEKSNQALKLINSTQVFFDENEEVIFNENF